AKISSMPITGRRDLFATFRTYTSAYWRHDHARLISSNAANERERSKNLRVLITGGAGFIGSHLSEAYLQRGDEVFVIDDLSTGSIENIRHLKDHSRFHYTIDSIHNQPVTAELVDQCDVIFHLAAAVGVKLIVESPVRTIE